MFNIHNHTIFSDGRFTPEQIVEAAVEFGLTHIGISDHFATSKVKCVSLQGLNTYVQTLETLKKKYFGTIELLIGVEMDSARDRTPFSEIDLSALNKLDYVLFEYVRDGEDGGTIQPDSLPRPDVFHQSGMELAEFIEFRDKLTIPAGLAHSDLVLNFRKTPPERLLKLFAEHKVFIELNTNPYYSRDGLQFYRLAAPLFQKIKDSEIEVKLSIGCDTHSRLSSVGNVHDAAAFVKKMNLEKNLLFEI